MALFTKIGARENAITLCYMTNNNTGRYSQQKCKKRNNKYKDVGHSGILFSIFHLNAPLVGQICAIITLFDLKAVRPRSPHLQSSMMRSRAVLLHYAKFWSLENTCEPIVLFLFAIADSLLRPTSKTHRVDRRFFCN